MVTTASQPDENSAPEATPPAPEAVDAPAPPTPAAPEASAAQQTVPVDASDDALASPQPSVVFVEAPRPPRVRGARGVGVVVAVLGAGVFAAAYAGLVMVLGLLTAPQGLAGAVRYLATPTFWIPVIVFALAYVLLVVVVNRAGWWAHVLGGFLVALVVWIGFVGAAIIVAGAFGGPPSLVAAVAADQVTNPLGFAAAIVAREVPIWVGWIVARRGRTARARNEAARAAYEQELAEHRATVSGRTAV